MPRTLNRMSPARAKTLSKPGLHADGGGLYLQVTRTADGRANRSWVFRFVVQGRERKMGLGSAQDVSLARARELAGACRLQRLDGHDPLRQREQSREEAKPLSFAECADQLVASHEAGWKNAKHRQQWRNTLATYAYPIMGNLSVVDVNTDHVMRALQPIWTTKPETAGRLRGRIEAVLSWAKARGLRTGENPATWRGHLDQLLPPKNKVRRVKHHAALPYTELPGFMAELLARGGVAAPALAFVILTAARTGEALGAQWPEIDLKAKLWTVPAERIKAGREHRVPLSGAAVAVLDRMASIRENEFVFPGQRDGRQLSDMALLMLLRDIRPGVTSHGFRSTFKDWAAELTATPNFISEAALAHVVADKVEAAYRRGDLLEKRRELMEAWATFCISGTK